MFAIIKRWKCGEIKRDNFDIKILKQIGEDSGALIAQGKNILGIKFNSDTNDVVTKLYTVEFIVGTSKIQPVYLGISSVALTNLSLYCIANAECTLTI